MVPRGGQNRRKSMEPRALGNVNGSVVKLGSSTSSLGGSRRLTTDPAEQEAAVQELRRLSPTPTPTESTSSPSRRESSSPSPSCSFSSGDQRDERRRTVTFSLHHVDQEQPRESGPPSPAPSFPSSVQPPATPSFTFACPTNLDDGDGDGDDNDTANPAFSPTTPFYLSEHQRLIQQTCPPRQLRQGLFDTKSGGSGSGNGDQSEDGINVGLKSRLEAAKRRSLVWRPKVGSPLAK